MQEVLIDIVWVFDLELDSNSNSSESKTVESLSFSASAESSPGLELLSLYGAKAQLAPFVGELLNRNLISTNLMLERLEPELLEAVGLVQSATMLKKKIARINTGLFYKQQKFNLMREESEGFSRLVAHLSTCFNGIQDADRGAMAESLHRQILQTIGYFDLDPNKVLDIIVDAFTFNLAHAPVFVTLLQKLSFPTRTAASVIGFKLRFVYEDKRFEAEYFERLFLTVSLLLQNGLLTLEEIYPHLQPADQVCLEEIETMLRTVKDSAHKFGIVNLSAKSSTTDKPQPNDPESLSEHYAQDILWSNLRQLQSDRNQKAHLVAALLAMGDFTLASAVLSRLPGLSNLLHLIPKHLSTRFCDYLETVSNNFDAKVDSEMLQYLSFFPSGGLSFSPQAFSQLCNRISILLKKDDSDRFALAIISQYLLPALMLSVMNSSPLSQELWAVLELLPVATRYGLYQQWLEDQQRQPLLLYSRAVIVSEAKKVLRRLAKETVRQYGRLVAKIAHSNPVVVLPLVLEQVQAYDNMIQPVVESFRFLTCFDVDVLVYSVLRTMSNPDRDRLKEDGTNLSDWFQALSSFTTTLFRRYYHYPALDLTPVIRYIFGQLVDDNCLDMKLLAGFIQKLAGIDGPETATEAVTEARGGGKLLKSETLSGVLSAVGQIKPPKKAALKLFNSIKSLNLVVPLMIAIGQAENAAIYRMEYEHVKLTSLLADTCQSVFYQYLDFVELIHSFDPTLLADSSLPCIEDLVNRYELDYSVALTMHRLYTKISCPSLEYISTPLEGTAIAPNCKLDPVTELFWRLDLSDIHVPASRYQAEIARCKAKDEALASTLESEMVGQVALRDQVLTILKSVAMQQEISIETLVNLAIIPRSLQSPVDALFSAKFLLALHQLNKAILLPAIDTIAKSSLKCISSLTEVESQNYGIFLYQILATLLSWLDSEERFKEDGFACDGPEYKELFYQWHCQLLTACVHSFKSESYMCIRNCIILLTRLPAVFPVIDGHAQKLEVLVAHIRAEDTREDLKVLATRVGAMLQQGRDKMRPLKQFTDEMEIEAPPQDAVMEQEEGEVECIESASARSEASSMVEEADDGPKRPAEALSTTESSPSKRQKPEPSETDSKSNTHSEREADEGRRPVRNFGATRGRQTPHFNGNLSDSGRFQRDRDTFRSNRNDAPAMPYRNDSLSSRSHRGEFARPFREEGARPFREEGARPYRDDHSFRSHRDDSAPRLHRDGPSSRHNWEKNQPRLDGEESPSRPHREGSSSSTGHRSSTSTSSSHHHHHRQPREGTREWDRDRRR